MVHLIEDVVVQRKAVSGEDSQQRKYFWVTTYSM